MSNIESTDNPLIQEANSLIEVIGTVVGLSYEDLTKKYIRAPREITDAQIICFKEIVDRVEGIRFYHIAEIFHKKNHSSVSNGLTLFDNLFSCNPSFKKKAKACREAVIESITTVNHAATV